MSDLVSNLREMARQYTDNQYNLYARSADRIEKLEARILLLEGWLNGSLNIIEAFVAADTKEARKALEGKDD